MGLDIRSYSNITKADATIDSESGEAIGHATRKPLDGEWCSLYPNSDFAEHAEGIEGAYRFKDSFGFCAGSYSGYNFWRERLAQLAGFAETPHGRWGVTEQRHDAGAWAASGGPFWELIYFSDCGGTIGPKTSAKLAKDFADHQEKADATGDPWFIRKYADWRKAFEMAANNGAVVFH